MWHPCGVVAVINTHHCLRGFNPINLGRRPFPVIFNLHGGQKVTPLFVGCENIVPVIILQLILNGCMDSILSGNANYTFIELFATDVLICLIVIPPFI